MVVESVGVLDFRNLADCEVELGPGSTCSGARTAPGRRTCSRRLTWRSPGRSCRTRDDRETIAFGGSLARVEVGSRGAAERRTLPLLGQPRRGRRHLVDGAAAGAEAAALRPALSVFMPDRLALVKGPPAGRRTHLDGFCAALWPAAPRPGAATRERCAAKRAARPGPRRGSPRPDLDAWDLGARGGRGRADRGPRRGDRPARRRRSRSAREALGLDASRAPLPAAQRRRPTPSRLAAELAERRESDLARGYTGWRPAPRRARARARRPRRCAATAPRASSGRALLALLFAERRALLDDGRPPPLMLLDDVTSELDAERRRLLVERLRAGGGQALITATEPGHLPAPVPARARSRCATATRSAAPRPRRAGRVNAALDAEAARRTRSRVRAARPPATLLAAVQGRWARRSASGSPREARPVSRARRHDDDRVPLLDLGPGARPDPGRAPRSASIGRSASPRVGALRFVVGDGSHSRR